MSPARNLEYTVINENVYHGQGHIINIAKRHTNRRWRQFTPEKQCNIQLQMVKASIIQAIELKGFGTYIVEISFKDTQNKLVTKLKYNFNFEDQAIKEDIVCETESGIKYVDVKLINNESNPRRMGINHFFMKGKIIKKQGEQNDDSDQENKKKRKKGAPNEVWVRQKAQGGDPWGLDEVSQDQEPEWKVKGSQIVQNVDKGKNKKKIFEKLERALLNGGQKDEKSCVKKQLSGAMKINDSQMTVMSQSRKRTKPNQKIEDIKLQMPKIPLNLQEKQTVGKSSRKFEKQFNLSKQRESEKQERKDINLQETQEQKKIRIKNQLIEKLKAKVNVNKK